MKNIKDSSAFQLFVELGFILELTDFKEADGLLIRNSEISKILINSQISELSEAVVFLLARYTFAPEKKEVGFVFNRSDLRDRKKFMKENQLVDQILLPQDALLGSWASGLSIKQLLKVYPTSLESLAYRLDTLGLI
jgi:hypothetical protein